MPARADRPPGLLGRAAWAVLAGALVFGSVADRPDDTGARTPVAITIDAATVTGRVTPIWDEVNLWKLYGRFGLQHPAMPPPNWLRDVLPWARYGRAVAALGGNYATAIASSCDHGTEAALHPYTRSRDCGENGAPGEAAQNELVRLVDGEPRIDYEPLRVAMERLLEAGVLPHLNISSAPAAFTAPAMDFTHYHWNASPVSDHEGWLAFVGGAFASVADLDTTNWRISIMNEANCLTLVGWDQQRRHVGYAGSPADYASTLVSTAARIRHEAPRVRFHLGNYVTSDTFPGEHNLAVYLTALGKALAAHPTLGWKHFDAISLSLYETPDTTVYEFVPARLARAAAAARAAGLPPLPFKIDELGIHSRLVDAFDEAWGHPLDPSLWAASWHAEALRVLLNAGNVVSVTPWFERLVKSNADGSRRPYPKAHVYELFGLLSGQLNASSAADDPVRFVPTERIDGLPRLAVSGERPYPPDAPRRRSARAGSLSAIASANDDGLRVLVIHHRNRPIDDDHRARRRQAARLHVTAAQVAPGAYAVRRLAIGGPDGAAWNAGTPRPLVWLDGGCHLAHRGALPLVDDSWIETNTVWLIDARRVGTCDVP